VVRLVRLSPHEIMRYRLRTLLLASAIGPPLLALTWWLDLTAIVVGVVLYLIVAGVVIYTWPDKPRQKASRLP